MESIVIGLNTFYMFYIISLLMFMFVKRKKAVINKEVRASQFKNYTGESPSYLITIKNHIENQFQIPVIFFIACLFVLQQNAVNLITVFMAALFVFSRMAHSFVHLGTNHLLQRAFCYAIGLFCVLGLFIQSFISSL